MIKVKNPAYPVPGLKLFRNIKCPENKKKKDRLYFLPRNKCPV